MGAAAILSASTAGAQTAVSPDGQTTTRVTTNPGGKISVDIAPTDASGLSRNTYSSFSVPKSGVDLNNSSANATTILNEVTSTKRSVIEGALTVVGPKANVIVANPNGITIDGATFANTAGVGLITGRSTAANPTQFVVDQGDVTVAAGGLAGSIQQLDLIAKQIRINGSVSVGGQGIDATAGSGTIALDANKAKSAQRGWLTSTATDAKATEASIVLESGAVLNGGSITMTANDKGAGVRLDNAGISAAGNFILTANGNIRALDTNIAAQGHVFVAGQDVQLASAKRQSSIVSQTSGIIVDAAGRFSSDGALMRGNVRSTFGFSALGAVSIVAADGIALSKGAFANQVSSVADGVSFETKGYFSDAGSTISSAGDVIVSSQSDVSMSGTVISSSSNLSVLSRGAVAVGGVDLKASESILFDVAALSMTSDATRRSTITAEEGGVFIASLGDVRNTGTLVQGKLAVKGDARSQGGVTVVSGGKLSVETVDEAQIGSFFSTEAPLFIDAKAGISNISGRLLANASAAFSTEGTFENAVALTVDEAEASNAGLAKRLFGSSRDVVDFGTYKAGREIAQVTAVDSLAIDAKKIVNRGGDITGGDVRLSATRIENEPQRLGSAVVRRKCLLGFCSYTGAANVTRDGGAISASKSMSIDAKESFLNVGGALFATDGIRISSPSIRFAALLMPNYYARPAGLSSLFAGGWGRSFYTFDGGQVATPATIAFDTDDIVVFEGTAISAAAAPVATKGIAVYNAPPTLAKINRRKIGLLGLVLP